MMKTLVTWILILSGGFFPLNARAEAEVETGWTRWGFDSHNTHYAPGENKITPDNVHLLKPKWVFQSQHDISVTPTLKGDYLYFTDWHSLKPTAALFPSRTGGKIYALDKRTGKEIWSKRIIDYSGNRAHNFSRNSPAIEGDKIYFGDSVNLLTLPLGVPSSRARVYGVDRFKGKLLWKTVVDKHFAATITQSPVVHDGIVYVGVSSVEELIPRGLGSLYPCCSFRGSMVALDAQTGKILWKTYLTPDNGGSTQAFSGVAVWGNSPAIDAERGVLYIGTGNNYNVPQILKTCLSRAAGNLAEEEQCHQKVDQRGNYPDSILALDLKSGAIVWAQQVMRYDTYNTACSTLIVPWFPNLGGCPRPEGEDANFGQAPMLLTLAGHGRQILVAGQKNGLFWAFDPDQKGKVLWVTQTGPGGFLGGHMWGSAFDGQRIYTQISNFNHKEVELTAGIQKGKKVNGGFWAALDPLQGKILWQTAVPASSLPLRGEGINHVMLGRNLGRGYLGLAMGPVTAAGGLLFAGSMDGHMYVLQGSTGEILWSFKTKGSVMSSPSLVDGVLYWGSGYSKLGLPDHHLYSFELP